jgi:aryl-alcohol dehydrogenase-like predicted oxidoreductase
MHYRRLGNAGMQLSEIGLGGWLTFGNALEREATRAVFDKAFDCGINFFDTANAYAKGVSEEVFGEMLAARPRESYVLATKVFFPMGPGVNERGLSRKHIMEQCHASLRRLRTDHIDLYQCHRHDEQTPLEETIRAMDDLVRQGRIVYWGFSEWPVEIVEKCLRICGDRFYRPQSSQPRYNMLSRQVEHGLFPLCSHAGIGQVCYSPLQQGVLTGKYKPNAPPPPGSRAADERQNQFIKKTLDDPAITERVQRLLPIAADLHLSMAQLALAWNLRRSEVTSCIIGATKPHQVEQNAEASGVTLDEETLRRIDEILT